MLAEELYVNIIGDATKLKNELSKASGQVSNFAEKIGKIGKTMTIVGGAVTTALGAIATKTTQLGDTYDKMSKRTNVAVETLSALGYAAKISGADLDTVEKSLRYLARGMNDASKGTGEAKDAFKELNISVTDTEGNLRPTIDVLKEAATKLAAMTDETKQVALATDMFGARYGTQLLPMLKEGGAGIEALMKKAKELGIVMSTEAAAKAAEFNDRLTDLKESLGAAGRNIGEILIPPLTELAKKAIEIIKKVKEWADAHKPLVEMIIKLSATIGAMAAAGGPILMAVSALAKMKTAIVAMGTISSGPIGIAIAAIAALAAGYLTLKQNVKSAEESMSNFRVKLHQITELKDLDALIADLTEKINRVKIGLSEVKPGEEYDDLLNYYETLNKRLEEAKKKREELTKVEEKSFEDILAEVNKMAAIGDILQPAEEAINKINETMTPYEKKLKAINDRYDEAEEKIKKYIKDEEELKAAIDKLNEGREAEIALLDRQKAASDKAAEAKKRLADLTKSLTDKIYEFTHTEYEVKLRDINREYDELIENAKQVYTNEYELSKAIEIINQKRQEEINKLKELNEVKDKAVEDNTELADSNKKLADSIESIAEKTEEAIEATEKLGILGGESWEGFTTHIKHTTAALSNFTKEGVAAAIASIKMKYFPILNQLYRDLETTGYVLRDMVQAQIENVNRMINAQIAQIKYGFEVYKEELKKLEGSGFSGGSFTIPSYQTGSPFVPKTGLAIVHQGKQIIPASQNNYDQRRVYSPQISITVQGNGDEESIKRAVQKALDESNRQYFRQGKEILLGV